MSDIRKAPGAGDTHNKTSFSEVSESNQQSINQMSFEELLEAIKSDILNTKEERGRLEKFIEVITSVLLLANEKE